MPMSEGMSSMEDASTGESRERGRGLIKCRIPQMMSLRRGRSPPLKGQYTINMETGRPRSAANRYKDPSPHPLPHPTQSTRQTRTDKEKPALKSFPNPTYVNPVFSSRVINERSISADEKSNSNCGDQELETDSLSTNRAYESNQEEPVSANTKKKMQLKIRWQENIVKFENIKRNLQEQQQTLLKLYGTLRASHDEMLGIGQTVYLPPPEDLTIMNVAKLSPDQLLQISAGALWSQQESPNATIPFNINLLHEIPNKIVATCEETLNSRQNIISWFEEVMSKKMITKTILLNKINQFKVETDEFRRSLEENKEDYFRFVKDTSDIITKSASRLLAYQMHSENAASKISELNALNEELKNQLRAAEQQMKYKPNKSKVEELEKELSEEKHKRTNLKERLSRAEIQHQLQVQVRDEKITQLKTSWEEANSRTLALEQKVVELRAENQKLQSDYELKMQKLNQFIVKNTKHLEEIMEDRSKLLTEKEDLERRLSELSKHYEDALQVKKRESNSNIAKLIEAEKKYNEVIQDKTNLEFKVESLTARLIESELRLKDVSKKLSDVEYASRDAAECRTELENLKHQLNCTHKELAEKKDLVAKQTEAMKELEVNWKNAIEIHELLKRDLNSKEKLILELEKQRTLLEQRLQESETKTESYEAQLSNLKKLISQLQEDFGEFNSWEELHEMIQQQCKQLRETTQQNNILSEALKKKEIELQQQMETVTEQGHLLEERDAAVKMLTEKDEEHTNFIKLLRNNLEMRTQADVEYTQQIAEKNTEIESLTRNVEMRKQQISQLEKIILTLENQTLKLSNQKRKARDTIQALERKLLEYENYYMTNSNNTQSTTDNLDELINILEYELGNSMESQSKRKSQEFLLNSQTLVNHQSKQEKHNKFKCHPENDSNVFKSHDNVPTKIVMGNYVKKTYIPNEDKHKGDNIGWNKAITNIQSSEWVVLPQIDVSATAPYPKSKKITIPPLPAPHQSRNIPYCLIPSYIGDEKKFKMFKFAGHRM